MRKPCCDKQDMNKGAWSKQEDQKLIDYIQKHGEGCWRTLPQAAGLLRCGKSCRLRWINYLRPDVKRGNFAEDEEDLIIKLHALLGNRWSLIAGRLPGRTDNEVKNYWNSHLRRKLIKMGVDPNNHRISCKIPPLKNSATLDSSASSSSKENGKNIGPTKPRDGGGTNCDLVSDAASGLEDESYSLPDLNLDLNMSMLSPSPCAPKDENKKPIHESKTSRDPHFFSSPALLLFQ